MKLRAVTFDCWNTLLYEADWHQAHALRVDALTHAAAAAGLDLARPSFVVAFDRAWARHMQLWEQGIASGACEIARWALEELGLPPTGPAHELLVCEFEEASHSGRVLALDGARELLRTLSERGLRLGLICDTGLTPGRVVRRHLQRLELMPPLEATIFSDEWSRTKPAAQLFRAALSQLACEPEHALHVGDLKRTDVAGARGVGMHSARIRARNDDESAHVEADFVVASHAELLEKLEVDGLLAPPSR